MATVPVVDEDTCIGCGNCAAVCPRVFEVVNEKSQVIGPGGPVLHLQLPGCDRFLPRAGHQLGGMTKPD